jgi:hypothetical protein
MITAFDIHYEPAQHVQRLARCGLGALLPVADTNGRLPTSVRDSEFGQVESAPGDPTEAPKYSVPETPR